jgi:hypothetical protein
LLLLCFAGILSFVTLLLQLITLACASLAPGHGQPRETLHFVQLLLCFAGIIIRLKIRTKWTVALACAFAFLLFLLVHLWPVQDLRLAMANESNACGVGLAYANQQMEAQKARVAELAAGLGARARKCWLQIRKKLACLHNELLPAAPKAREANGTAKSNLCLLLARFGLCQPTTFTLGGCLHNRKKQGRKKGRKQGRGALV